MTEPLHIEKLKKKIGDTLYVSPWVYVTQDEINTFGRVTRDFDPAHMDPAYAREHSPFKETVLYGFQTLSMLSHLCDPLRHQHDSGDIGYDINYGLNKVRFITPIPVNAKFRNHMKLLDVTVRPDGSCLVTTLNTIEVEGQGKPAMTAEWIGLISRESPSQS